VNKSKPIVVSGFGSKIDPLSKIQEVPQLRYLKCYLEGLDVRTVVEEPNYFDRDYLAEFASFYSTSVLGYPNVCRRLHFFSTKFTKREFVKAVSGETKSVERLKQSYLGFTVIRPIQDAPFGRTVLKWYPEKSSLTPRIKCERNYKTHIAGIEFEVRGLAWQQQDSGVGACATVALWSLLQSSALDDYHAIPTTSEITKFAHKKSDSGARVFPSKSLKINQLCEAIKELNLSPIIVAGQNSDASFGPERFVSSCASIIRSGYPLIVTGAVGKEGHAICVVGFRERTGSARPGQINLQDGNVSVLYIHDDNLGPNVRFRMVVEQVELENGKSKAKERFARAVLRPEVSDEKYGRPCDSNPILDFDDFVPQQLIMAVNEDLRISPDRLHLIGTNIAASLRGIIVGNNDKRASKFEITMTTKFIKNTEYVSDELVRMLSGNPKLISKARMSLWEKVRPMSFHLGLLKIGIDGTPMFDVLFDTTERESSFQPFATLVFCEALPIEWLAKYQNLGTIIHAY
jgi:hypothetical protein